MEERRSNGFRVTPNFGQVLGYIAEGEPLDIPLPNRRASIYTSSHFYLDHFPNAPEPISDAPLPHTSLNPALAFETADEGYDGAACRSRAFKQLRRSSLAELRARLQRARALRRVEHLIGEDWLDRTLRIPRRPPGLGPPPDEVPPPQIIGRPSEVEPLLERAGQRSAEVERAAAQDIEQFASQQLAEAEASEGFATAAESAAATAEAATAVGSGRRSSSAGGRGSPGHCWCRGRSKRWTGGGRCRSGAGGAFDGCAGSGAGGATSSTGTVLGGFGLFLLPGG
eukprot:s10388_g1.t1